MAKRPLLIEEISEHINAADQAAHIMRESGGMVRFYLVGPRDLPSLAFAAQTEPTAGTAVVMAMLTIKQLDKIKKAKKAKDCFVCHDPGNRLWHKRLPGLIAILVPGKSLNTRCLALPVCEACTDAREHQAIMDDLQHRLKLDADGNRVISLAQLHQTVGNA